MKIYLVGTIHGDPLLKGVTRLMEPGGPERFLNDLAAEAGMAKPDRIRVVRQRVGQRLVLRIDSSSGGGSHYVKLLRSASAGSEARLAWQREAAAAAASCGVAVPAPVAYLPRFRALVYPALEGRPFLGCAAAGSTPDELLATATVDPALLGRRLAELHHRIPLPAKREGMAAEPPRVRRAIEKVAAGGHPIPGLLEERLRRVECRMPDRATTGHPAAIHGDLHPMQILAMDEAGGRTLAILDWDAAAEGDGERDLGNLIAHFDLEAEIGHIASATARQWTDQILAGYSAARHIDPARLDFYRMTTLLRIAALHADPAFGHSPPNPATLPARLVDRLERPRSVNRDGVPPCPEV